ncbi:MAG: DUF934 domain-containing protein [Betaproteobacteria bacterium]|nr:DUF934 domain-containing protein [Betaproteobacteria bacterium]
MELILQNGVNHASNAAEPGVLRLANDADVLALAASGGLAKVQRIELAFPKFTDGRAFSQAFALRRRAGFAGDIRATGDVLADQLVQMKRCGFSSAVLRSDQRLAVAQRQLQRFADFYQGDAWAPAPRFARATASTESA